MSLKRWMQCSPNYPSQTLELIHTQSQFDFGNAWKARCRLKNELLFSHHITEVEMLTLHWGPGHQLRRPQHRARPH